MRLRLAVAPLCASLLLSALSGCKIAPYQYGHFHEDGEQGPETVTVEYGKPNKTLDGIGKIVGFPAKILPMNAKINDHEISRTTENKLREYLARNDLNDVAVFINHYDPKRQWQRLRDNKRVGAGWRYTAGAISVIGYTVFPGRIFGGDSYNPYTNSLYLNSDVSAMVLREAAYSKDVHSQKMPGTYAVIQDLPVLGLWSDTLAVRDVIGYAREQGDWEVEKEAYHVLYPQMGIASTSIGGMFLSSAWWGGAALGAGGAAVGHVAGRTAAKREQAKHDAREQTAEAETVVPLPPVQQAGFESTAREPAPPIRLPPVGVGLIP
ncbi:MAG TPA: hypothetical protein VHD36_14010 [Pirellulales bacterium]|nr:hypothetical protein [Pirellulales bacterium]